MRDHHRTEIGSFIAGVRRHRAHQKAAVLGVIAGATLIIAAPGNRSLVMFLAGIAILLVVPLGTRTWCRAYGCTVHGLHARRTKEEVSR